MVRELFVSRLGGRLWTALREDGATVEFRVERHRRDAPVGRILKARVTTILPGIQSAFLDIGTERGGFLHAKDLVLPGEPAEHPPIEQRLSVGRDLLVQISRERLRAKGPKVTCFLSIPGRFVVLLPQAGKSGVSRRIEEPEERERLSAILGKLPGNGVGFVARTAARGVGEAEIRADAAGLMRTWCEIQDRAERLPAPSVVYREPGLLLRLLRELPHEDLQRVVLDDEEDRNQALAYLREADPLLASRLELHPGPVSLFQARGLHEEIEKALRPRIWLHSGGTIVVEETEALVSIDVNTGKFLGRGGPEETALKTNLEAAREIARQLRLRDLGGIVVIDFIDMLQEENWTRVQQELEEHLKKDRSRTKIVGLSELGLLQLTRKRTQPTLGALLERSCPLCAGHGRIPAPRTVAASALHELRRAAAANEEGRFVVRAHPDLVGAIEVIVEESEFAAKEGREPRVRVRPDPSLPPHRFELDRTR